MRMAKPGHSTPHSCPSVTQHHPLSPYNTAQRTRSKRFFFTSPSLLLLASFVLLSSTFSSSTTEAAAPARRGHSGTSILNEVHFVGGLGTAAPNDTIPLKSITTLDLLSGNTTEKVLTQGIYNHAASTTPFAFDEKESVQIGLSFGQTTGGAPMGALDWVGPVLGNVIAAPNVTTSRPYAQQPLAARAGHSMVQYDTNNLWVFGGYTLPQNQLLPARDTPTFDYSSKVWSNQTKIGLYRYGHASAVASTDSIISCYGTILSPPKEKVDTPTSDCVNFSIMKTTFTKINLIFPNKDDTIIGGLIGHSLVASPLKDGKLYMFGGTNEKRDKYNQDIYKLDTANLPDVRITKVTPSDDMALVPSARSDHVAVAVGEREGFMIIHGGVTGPTTMADGEAHYYCMATDKWLDMPTFIERYKAQQHTDQNEVSPWVLIAGILAGVSVLGGCVGMYIWRGIRKDTARRLEREAADRQSVVSPDFAAMEAAAAESRMSGTLSGKKGRTPHPIYGMAEEDDHSLSNGPFKSTSSLIQAENGAKKTKSKGDNTYHSSHSKPWVTEPASPGGTTLTENGSISGYYSSSSSQTPSRLNKKGSNASSQNSMGTRNINNNTGSNNRPGAGTTSESYYNPRDLYVDEDDDSSITVSLASESSTNMSPWTGPVRVSTDLAPPNPRFSRGAIPQAHRQLVDAIATGAASPMPPTYAFTSNRNSNGWDTSSPGGSLSSRDDEYHRRSVNSMQWVSFEPMDLAGRPESQIYDPLSHQQYQQQQQRSGNGNGGGLTVRNNASMYRTSLTSQPITIPSSTQNNPRMSMFGGSNTSDTNTEDSGSYYGPGGKRISTALAARQQRRSIRDSQDSLNSANGGRRHSYQQQQQMINNSSSKAGEEEEVFVTKVLPIITNKVTKPTLAKVVTQQRGSRIVVPSAGPLSDQRSPSSRPSEEGIGLGIDFSGSSTSQDTYMSGYGSGGGVTSNNNPRRTSYQTRRTSNLNPNKSATNNSRQQQRESTNIILKMPPAPKHTDSNSGGGGGGSSSSLNPRSRDQQQQQAAPGVRNSIMDVGQDLSGYF